MELYAGAVHHSWFLKKGFMGNATDIMGINPLMKVIDVLQRILNDM